MASALKAEARLQTTLLPLITNSFLSLSLEDCKTFEREEVAGTQLCSQPLVPNSGLSVGALAGKLEVLGH